MLAIGVGLGPERILPAYEKGIFPWYDEQTPVLWWSPDPRLVIYPDQIHISKTLGRLLKQGRYQVTFDQQLKEVIKACAQTKREGQNGTWILGEMQDAYFELHQMGFAHSVEVWEEGELIGGLYGVSLGSAFFGESMFSHRRDASKVALAVMCKQLLGWGFDLVDCQVPTEHLKRMGAVEISRERFLELLEEALEKPTRKGTWRMEI